MPRSTITTGGKTSTPTAAVSVAPTALTEVAADASNFNLLANSGREILVCRNSAGSSATIKFYDRNGNLQGAAVTLAANKTYVFGPFRTDLYNDVNGNVSVDVSAATVFLTFATLQHGGTLIP